MVQTGRNRGTSGRNRPEAWVWESCHMSEVRFEEVEDEVNGSQRKTNDGGRF